MVYEDLPGSEISKHLSQNDRCESLDITFAKSTPILATDDAASPDIVLFCLGKVSGSIHLIQEARANHPNSVIIVFAEFATGANIVNCIQRGADEFMLLTAMNFKNLRHAILKCYQMAALKKVEPAAHEIDSGPFVGKTIRRIAAMIPNIINSAIKTVHVTGETGTGKEVVAELFHQNLDPTIPFVKVNCGAITPNLMESEFFGHVKGSFTGASQNKIGYLERASGGWIFLDEVANLTKEAQAALLRAIENQEITRVGESQVQPIDVRVISASNEDLEKLVQEGQFRQDLWQRLTERNIQLPPLRYRTDEIREIIAAILKQMAGGPYIVTEAAMEILANISWRNGNVRQLRNCLRAMTEFHLDYTLSPSSIPQKILMEYQLELYDNVVELPTTGEFQDQAHSLTLTWGQNQEPSFDDLADQLLVKMIKRQRPDKHGTSLRKLALSMGMVRNTLANRMKVLAKKELLKEPEILRLIGHHTS